MTRINDDRLDGHDDREARLDALREEIGLPSMSDVIAKKLDDQLKTGQDPLGILRAFEVWAQRRGLELDKTTDAWGRPTYKHPHINSMWLGWRSAAAKWVPWQPETKPVAWQPIETAPKDGTEIILWGVMRGHEHPWKYIGNYFNPYGKDGWWVAHTMPVAAELWAPLPDAPSLSALQSGGSK